MEKAKENVQKEARGASPLSLIKSARTQSGKAKDCELKGDLKGTLNAVTKAASLAQMCMDSPEFIAEGRGKRGVLHKEFTEFMEVSCLHYYGGTDLEVISNSVVAS